MNVRAAVHIELDAMPKYLFYYEKAESVRWLGHLDILRAFERAVRRAELPIAFTLGFNPRVRISFASPLSTGTTGSTEPAIIELIDEQSPIQLSERLNSVLPPGIRVQDFCEIPDAGSRDLLNSFAFAEYLFTCSQSSTDPADEAKARHSVEQIMLQSEINVVREREGRSKTLNIRPYVASLQFEKLDRENMRLTFRVVAGIGESGNVRPGDIAEALSLYIPGLALRRAHRVCLHQNQNARLDNRAASDLI